MDFTNLTTELQTIYLVQYGFMFKGVLLFGGLLFALFYLFYWKSEKETPTALFSVGFIRSILTIFAYAHLYLFPLSLLLLNPEYTLANAVSMFYPIYLTLLVFGGLCLMIDLFYYTPTILLKIAGLDTGDKRVQMVYKKIKKYFKKNGYN